MLMERPAVCTMAGKARTRMMVLAAARLNNVGMAHLAAHSALRAVYIRSGDLRLCPCMARGAYGRAVDCSARVHHNRVFDMA